MVYDGFAITYNDLGISWGPAVHYLELWNEFNEKYSNEYELIGYAPTWTNKSPIINIGFTLKQIKVPNIPIIRQIIYDLYLCAVLIMSRKKIIYMRFSSTIFSLLIIHLLRQSYTFSSLI